MKKEIKHSRGFFEYYISVVLSSINYITVVLSAISLAVCIYLINQQVYDDKINDEIRSENKIKLQEKGYSFIEVYSSDSKSYPDTSICKDEVFQFLDENYNKVDNIQDASYAMCFVK